MSDSPVQVTSLDSLSKYNISKIAVAIGIFDGVHLGHREIIKNLVDIAAQHKADPVVITFSPHPRQVLFPDKKLRFLRSPEAKADILGKLGVKAVVTVPFNKEFACMEPDEFIKKLVFSKHIKLIGICVGTEWKFGSGAKGDQETLEDFSKKYHFIFKAVKETSLNGQIVSSTSIRNALTRGNFNTANQMLNCKYVITGYINSFDNYKDNDNYKVFIKYGILPPKGKYKVYINSNNKKVNINVVSETELTISAKDLQIHNKKIEIEFNE